MEMTQLILLKDLTYYQSTSQSPLLTPTYIFKPLLVAKPCYIALPVQQTLEQVL